MLLCNLCFTDDISEAFTDDAESYKHCYLAYDKFDLVMEFLNNAVTLNKVTDLINTLEFNVTNQNYIDTVYDNLCELIKTNM